MTVIDKVWVAALTRNKGDAGSDSPLNLTINIDGLDVVDQTFRFGVDHVGQERGQAGLDPVSYPFPPPASNPLFESDNLTASSIRMGIRDDDAWAPDALLVMGRTAGKLTALGMETEVKSWLSTDKDEGHLSLPIRLVGAGSANTPIHRVLLLIYTAGGSNVGTDSAIELEITAKANIVLKQQIVDTPQTDLEEYTANWYMLDAAVPFVKSDISAAGGIKLKILGSDAFDPTQVFVFGLDTPSGRPKQVITLVSELGWNLGWLSTDPSEGSASVNLPLA
jgi:hypothetical protein